MFTWQYFVAASVSLIQLLSSTITQKAIKLEHPSIVSVVQSSDILFAIILQNLFANVKSNWLVILGSILVTTSIFLVGIHKFWNERKKLSNETNDMNSKM
jgi:drug/metabolite transporter (DMT)-like permease